MNGDDMLGVHFAEYSVYNVVLTLQEIFQVSEYFGLYLSALI